MGIITGMVIMSFVHRYLSSTSAPEKNVLVVQQPRLHPTTTIAKHPAIKPQTPHYDFYNLLSTKEKETDTLSEEPKESAPTTPFQLNIATFTNFIDANQLRAELLLLGVDNVHIVKLYRHQHFTYKVISGPFQTKEAMAETALKLKNNKIHPASTD